MTLADLFVAIFFSVLLFISGCSSVSSEVQAGRNALQTGRANDAVGYLTQAAAVDPNYKIPYRVQVSVLTYLGRAYLETGKATEARQTLERAVKLDNDDSLAHLYLGIAMLKTGEVERGRKEIEIGLRAIDDTLEYIQEDRVSGFYWDPNMQIRNDTRKLLASESDNGQLISESERIGGEFDEETTRHGATRAGDVAAAVAMVAVAGVDDRSLCYNFARTLCHHVFESAKSHSENRR